MVAPSPPGCKRSVGRRPTDGPVRSCRPRNCTVHVLQGRGRRAGASTPGCPMLCTGGHTDCRSRGGWSLGARCRRVAWYRSGSSRCAFESENAASSRARARQRGGLDFTESTCYTIRCGTVTSRLSGEMPERFKGPVCKIGALMRVGGSNPSLPTAHELPVRSRTSGGRSRHAGSVSNQDDRGESRHSPGRPCRTSVWGRRGVA